MSLRESARQRTAGSCTPRSPRPGRSLLRSPPHPPLAGPACHHAAQAPSAMEYSMESYEPTTPSTVTIVAAFSGGGDEQTVHVIGAPAGQRCSLFLFQNRRGTATRDRKRQTPKGGRWLAPHRPLLKIPVWWRRAVLPSLPWVVALWLSFLFSLARTGTGTNTGTPREPSVDSGLFKQKEELLRDASGEMSCRKCRVHAESRPRSRCSNFTGTVCCGH